MPLAMLQLGCPRDCGRGSALPRPCRCATLQPEGAHAVDRLLNDAAKLLKMTGQQQRVDEWVAAMNRAVEAAVPEALENVFVGWPTA